MKIVVYYGGRGLLDDPTLYVLKKMEDVLRELRVSIERYNIYEHKNEIATLPQTFKEADGIILATTIEWLGIGGYMQQFLDACWLYGDKEKISHTYMQPIVMSTTYGEREGEMTLSNAWEILGGLPCPGLCGYVEDLTTFQMNKDFGLIIEKKAENLYRTISQKIKSLPSSNQAIKQNVSRTQSMNLTPQESEQLSKYVSDDSYVKQQKEDIEELASMFKDMLGQTKSDEDMPYIKELESHFIPTEDFKARYSLIIEDIKKPLYWCGWGRTCFALWTGKRGGCGCKDEQKCSSVHFGWTNDVPESLYDRGNDSAGEFQNPSYVRSDFCILKDRRTKMRDDNCIFCKLANGDIPTNSIYEDEDFNVILDASPATKGHALILPKNHFANLFEIPEDMDAKAFILAKKIAKKMKDVFGCDGVNIVQNNGVAAGQTVFHFHIHLIPRYEGDHAGVTWKPGTLTDEQREEILQEWK